MMQPRYSKTINGAKYIDYSKELNINSEKETQNMFKTNKYYNDVSTNKE